MTRYFYIILFLIPVLSFGQGILNNGAQIVLSSTAQVLIDGNGNWTNNGTVTAGSSTVHFIGTANQSILGTNTTAFYNLTVNNTGGDVIVGRNISVSNTLQMTSGDFDLKNYIVDFGTTGLLNNEASTRRIKATDGGGFDGMGTGTITATRTNPSGNVAGLGLNIVPAANLGSTILVRGHERQAGSGTFSGNWSVFRYYELQPTTYQNCDFTFNYYPAWELNGHVDGNLIAFQRVQYFSGGLGPIYWEILPTVNTTPVATATTVFNVLQNNIRVTLGSNVLPLPVELADFTAECAGSYVTVSWTTLSENNNDYFTIEKSIDGSSYSEIEIIQGAGNSNELLSYSFIDYKPNPTINYYRLKQVDIDGRYSYSDVATASCKDDINSEDIIIYNSQYNQNIVITLKGSNETRYYISFTDQLGRLLINKEFSLYPNNDNQFLIDKSGLSAGVYNITLRSEKNVITKQVIICKY